MREREAPSTEPLIDRSGEAPWGYADSHPIAVSRFARDALRCADNLPDHPWLINVCSDRYLFGVAFFAALLRGRVNLLPSQRSSEALGALRRTYPDSAIVDDETAAVADPSTRPADPHRDLPPIDTDQLAAIVFTSGSTGAPSPHPKTWGLLSDFRAIHWRRLSRALEEAGTLAGEVRMVSTVPSWHLYGLEWTLLLPSIAPVSVHSERAFFPKDVVDTLGSSDTPTVLVTTPTHLRALLKAPPPARPVSVTICATAPLDTNLAVQAERRLGTRILELYGCSEVGTLASRRPTEGPGWSFFDYFQLAFSEDGLTVRAPRLEAPVELADRFERLEGGRFEFLGRSNDIVKIAGKRESLANLNTLLLGLPGVQDGVIFLPQRAGEPSERLAAFVVAPDVEPQDIRREMARRLDPAFLPRPIRMVDAIPRNRTGKTPLGTLTSMLDARAVPLDD